MREISVPWVPALVIDAKVPFIVGVVVVPFLALTALPAASAIRLYGIVWSSVGVLTRAFLAADTSLTVIWDLSLASAAWPVVVHFSLPRRSKGLRHGFMVAEGVC